MDKRVHFSFLKSPIYNDKQKQLSISREAVEINIIFWPSLNFTTVFQQRHI